MIMSMYVIQKKVIEVMKIFILVFSFLAVASAANAETLLHCKFKVELHTYEKNRLIIQWMMYF